MKNKYFMRVISITANVSFIFIFLRNAYAETFCYSEIKKYDSYQEYKIDINKDNIKDRVLVNTKGNELLFFIKEHGKYHNVFIGDNYTMDGIYALESIKGISRENLILSLKTTFNGSGGQKIEYLISYQSNMWKTEKRITKEETFSDKFNAIEKKLCELTYANKEEKCQIIIENVRITNEVKQYLYSVPNKKTKMYLIKGDKVTLLDEQTDDKCQKWYFINYKGKKDLNMWIKAEAVDMVSDNTK